MRYKSYHFTYTNLKGGVKMRQKARHYRAVQRQKETDNFNELYPVCMDYSALAVVAGACTLIGLLIGLCLSHNK